MAITVMNSPQQWQPGYNENVWVLSSNIVNTYYKFKYVCDVYATDGVTRLARLKLPARPDHASGYAFVDVHRVVENYVTDNFGVDVTDDVTENFYRYGVQFGEEYSTTSGGVAAVIPASGFTSIEYRNVFNACLNYDDFRTYASGSYILNRALGTGIFLTNKPSASGSTAARVQVRSDEREWLYCAIRDEDQAGRITKFLYVPFDANGNVIGSILEYSCGTGRYHKGPAGPANIAQYGVTLPSGTVSYNIGIELGGVILSHVRFYTINDACSRYQKRRIHFLNKLGGIDSFTFDQKSFLSSDISREKFRKKTGSLSGSSYGYSALDRQDTVFDTSEIQKWRFNSNWVTDDIRAWLNELITSPKVWLDDNSTSDNESITPLVVDTSSFEWIRKENQPLHQLEFEASFTIPNKRQRA